MDFYLKKKEEAECPKTLKCLFFVLYFFFLISLLLDITINLSFELNCKVSYSNI